MKKNSQKQFFLKISLLVGMLTIGLGVSTQSAHAAGTYNLGNINTQTLVSTSHTVTYTAGAHGAIFGTTPQTVTFGGDTTNVLAVPSPGYIFVQWSDGVTTAARNHTGVVADTTVSAIFALDVPLVNTNNVGVNLPATYTLSYSAQGNRGNILGTNPQTVSLGANGTSVTAVANNGYVFSRWSDGLTTATRTDTGIAHDVTRTALFVVASSGGSGSSYVAPTPSQILGSGVCSADLTITQKLKSGARDGQYLAYNNGVVTQVAVLQKQINRILAASYNQAAGPVDGKFGPLTKLGVQRLQAALMTILHADLGPAGTDGVVGAYTRAAINNSCGN